jgi:hypothetical protein
MFFETLTARTARIFDSSNCDWHPLLWAQQTNASRAKHRAREVIARDRSHRALHGKENTMHRSTSRRLSAAILALAAIIARPTKLLAANQEPAGLNLGLTSFFDGFGPSSEGFTYQAYLTFANATSIHDGDGHAIQCSATRASQSSHS